jgi:hypothetical protein
VLVQQSFLWGVKVIRSKPSNEVYRREWDRIFRKKRKKKKRYKDFKDKKGELENEKR